MLYSLGEGAGGEGLPASAAVQAVLMPTTFEATIMFDPIDLSFYADAVLDELASGEPQIDGTILLDLARRAQEPGHIYLCEKR